ncbi:TonB family protein [Pseudophaeobacter sp. A-200-2]|uniref:energy transducer TonB n=1 Tax=Pseudophaeobacter sp. A-200-2 TaxID=3098145 RepID=UPI0034D3D5E4
MSRVPQSRFAALLALTMAAVAHAGAVVFTDTAPVEQAGGETALAAEGSAFANLAVGVEAPQPAAVMPEQPRAAQQTPEAAQPVETPQVQRQAQFPMLEPVFVPVVTAAQTPGIEVTPPQVHSDPIPLKAVTPTPPTTALPPTQPAVQQAAKPMEAVEQEPVEQAEAPQPPMEQAPPVEQSLKPRPRPLRPPQVAKAEAVHTPPEPTTPSAQPRGNSNANATRGVAEGAAKQPGGQSRQTGSKARQQGNAAASNYPGLILRRIERAKRRANVRGEAVVAFRIAPSGGLAQVAIARSSGSARLDDIALAQVRRAAPFPPPPAGARTSFAVRIKGK